MKFASVRLGDLIKVHYGKALKAADRVQSGEWDVYGSSGLVGKHDRTLLEEPTLIIGRKGSVGEVTYAPVGGWTIDTAFYVTLINNAVDLRYLYYAVRRAGLAQHTITTSIPGINREDIYSTEIPLPPLSEQKRIAAILDRADAIRRKRRQAIELTEQFLKSAFLEMFGDPATNPKNLPLRQLKEFYVNSGEGTKCGPFGGALKKHEYVSSGIPVWNMDNISKNGEMLRDIGLWITDRKYDDLAAYSVQDGDIIISRAGTVGKMCAIRAGLPKSIISTNLIRLRLGRTLLPEFFVSLMVYCKGRVGRLKTGPDGAFTHMSTGVLDTLTFPYPPVDKQEAFVRIIRRVEEARERSTIAQTESDTLFHSLVQRAFRGEL